PLDWTGNVCCLAAAGRPRGWRRCRASGLAPDGHDLYPALGAKNALLGRLRRPPGAWPAWPPCPAGYRRTTSPHPYLLVLERASRESPVPSPPSPGLEVRGAGARMVCPPCRARY